MTHKHSVNCDYVFIHKGDNDFLKKYYNNKTCRVTGLEPSGWYRVHFPHINIITRVTEDELHPLSELIAETSDGIIQVFRSNATGQYKVYNTVKQSLQFDLDAEGVMRYLVHIMPQYKNGVKS